MKPTKHEDGTETIRIYGKTVDVTGKKSVTVFKRDYKIVRPRAKKVKVDDESIETEVEVAQEND